MKDELQLKLVEILTSIQTAAGKASDFALEQLPDIAQSYVAYGRVLYTSGLFFTFLMIVAGIVLAYLGIKKQSDVEKQFKEEHGPKARMGYFDKYDGFAHFFPAGVLALIGVTGFGLVLPGAFLVWISPKVWLLKEIASLLK